MHAGILLTLMVPGNREMRDILAATLVRILVASSRVGRGIAGTPLGQQVSLD